MPQPVLHRREHIFLTPGVGPDQPRRIEPGLRQPRREEIATAAHPQGGSIATQSRPRAQPRHEQGSRGLVPHRGAGRREIVERIEPETAVGEVDVERRDAKGHDLPRITLRIAGKRGDLRAKLGKHGC